MAHEWYSQKRRASYHSNKHDKIKRKANILIEKYNKEGRREFVRDLVWLMR